MAIILTGDAAETVSGTTEPDRIEGGGGDDTLNGGCYGDELLGGTGADVLNGGHDGDELYATDESSTDADADVLNGGHGDDSLFGGARDTLNGGAGFDEAALGFESLTTDAYFDFRSANGGAGDASFSVVFGQVGQLVDIEELQITTGSGADTILDADWDADITTGAGNDRVVAGDGFDNIDLGVGDDYASGGQGSDDIQTGDGADIAEGGAGDDTINDFGNDFTTGSVIWDDGEQDTLRGGAGSDELYGSSRDILEAGSGGSFEEDKVVVAYAGEGAVVFDVRGVTAATTYFTGDGGWFSGAENIGVITQDANDVALDNNGDGYAATQGGADVLIMAGGDDVAIGGSGADYIDGGVGDDELTANSVSEFLLTFGFGGFAEEDNAVDTLLGGAGEDEVYFGAGDFASGGDAATAGASEIDTAHINLSNQSTSLVYDFQTVNQGGYYGLAGGGGFSDFEQVNFVAGSGSDTLVGNNLSGNFDGGAGNDILIGLGGFDILTGAAGDDYLDGGDGLDILSDSSFGGGSVSSGGVDQMFGGGGDDSIDGDGDAGVMDILVGGAGNDTIRADYTDYVDAGETTNDRDVVYVDFSSLAGGIYYDFAGADEGGAISFFQFGGQGSLRGAEQIGATGTDGGDTLLSGEIAGFFDGGDGNDVLVGRGGDDRLDGEDGTDFLDGGVGNDSLDGGRGNDTIYGGDGRDFISAGVENIPFEGNDPAEVDDDIVLGEGGDDFIDTGDGFDFIDGGVGNDFLDGGGRDDVVIGGAGNDSVAGGCGDDRLTGGEGQDVFVLVGTTTGEFDTVTDFTQAQNDRFRIDNDTQFTALEQRDVNGDGTLDTVLSYSGGQVAVLGVTGLTLETWNGFLV